MHMRSPGKPLKRLGRHPRYLPARSTAHPIAPRPAASCPASGPYTALRLLSSARRGHPSQASVCPGDDLPRACSCSSHDRDAGAWSGGAHHEITILPSAADLSAFPLDCFSCEILVQHNQARGNERKRAEAPHVAIVVCQITFTHPNHNFSPHYQGLEVHAATYIFRAANLVTFCAPGSHKRSFCLATKKYLAEDEPAPRLTPGQFTRKELWQKTRSGGVYDAANLPAYMAHCNLEKIRGRATSSLASFRPAL